MSTVALGWTVLLCAAVSGGMVGLMIGLWFDAQTTREFWDVVASADRLADLAAADRDAWRDLARELAATLTEVVAP